MELIRKWLNGQREYRKGVLLYLQYGKDDNLKSLLKKEGETDFKKKKLTEALEKTFEDFSKSFTPGVNESNIPENNPAPQKETKDIPDRWAKSYADPVLESLKNNWQKCYSEMKMLQHKLLDISTQEERCATAHRILDLDDACDEFYAKRDYYMEHKKLPEDIDSQMVGDPTKWPLKLQNAKKYIRDYKSKLRKEPDNVRYVAKIQQYEKEVAYYEDKLKMYAD